MSKGINQSAISPVAWSRTRVRRLLAVIILLCLITPLLGACGTQTPANQYAFPQYDIANGELVDLEGKVGVRFDLDDNSYRNLNSEAEQLLLANYEMEKSDCLVVNNVEVTVAKEYVTEDKGDRSISYDLYYLKVKLKGMIPEGTPEGIYGLRFQFPAVLAIRDALQAITPTATPEVIMTIQNHDSPAKARAVKWWKHALLAIGLLLVWLVILASAGGGGWWGRLFVAAGAIASLFVWYLTLSDLWLFSPIFSLVVASALVIGVFLIIRAFK
jgi:hypothetical protein